MTPALSKPDELSINKLRDGGFVVSEPYHHPGQYRPFLLACTTIEEALKYIKKTLNTETK